MKKIIRILLILIFLLICLNTVNAESTEIENAIWLWGVDMYNINFNTLKESHIDTIFLNYGAIEMYGKDNVSQWIQTANNKGIKVHIWMQVLYHNDFQDPLINGTINQTLLQEDIQDAKEYASIPGVSGIVLDYIRYPGTASQINGSSQAITSFVSNITKNIKEINPNLVVSGALMPEETTAISNYGQNLTELSNILDYIIPMMYKGNYKQNSTWIESTTHYFVTNSEHAKVIISLQTYESDNNISQLSSESFAEDINAAYSGGANNIGIFRYGLTNFENYNHSLSLMNNLKVKLNFIFNIKI